MIVLLYTNEKIVYIKRGVTMNTNSLKTFIAVCEHAGFSAAAKELGYTQSTVSSQIKQLEAELQVRLFDRYYHRVSLTEEGILVLQQARNILMRRKKCWHP